MLRKLTCVLLLFPSLVLTAQQTLAAPQAATAQPQWVSPLQPPTPGAAPKMKVQLVSENGPEKTYAVIFGPGDEIIGGLIEFSQKFHVEAARFTAIGGVDKASIGTFHLDRKQYLVHPVTVMSEVTSLMGDIALYKDKPVIHGHMVVAGPDGKLIGGHLLQGYVYPTLEVMVTVEPVALRRRPVPELDITVIDPDVKP